MKRILLLSSLSLLTFVQANAQKQKPAKQNSNQGVSAGNNEKRFMEAWMEYMRPGEMHLFLQRANGKFM